jgi:putative OPT family oligopeptide transporter
MGALVWTFTLSGPFAGYAVAITAAAIPFIVIAGFIVAAICGYMAGLIGSSNSPVSGVGILAIVACSALMALLAPVGQNANALAAIALFITAIVFGVAVTSNDNLQDLKTGQLVGAAPWRQQIALIVGIIAGAAVIPPVLNILAQAYGFAGAAHTSAISTTPLPAPQASLISSLALGVIGQKLNWSMIGIGGVLGVVIVALDGVLGARGRYRLPPLAVGMGIYLPMSATLPVMIGAMIGWWFNRAAALGPFPARTQHLGILIASGMIVGESLFSVLLAGLIVGVGRDAPLALAPADFPQGPVLGVVAFVSFAVFLYAWTLRRGAHAPGE